MARSDGQALVLLPLIGEEEGGTTVGRLASAQISAAVAVDACAAPRARPTPVTLVVLLAVEPLEHTEQLVHVGHVEAHPVVPHEVDRLAVPARELPASIRASCAAAR